MRRRVRLFLGCGALLLGYVGYAGYRLIAFAREAAPLQDAARQFPTSYIVGARPTLTYVALGDSTAVGVGASVVEESLTHMIATSVASGGSGVSVRNLAVSGARLEDVVREQLPRLPAGPISLVTISISANDATHNSDPVRFEADLETLLKSLGARGVGVAVLTTTPNYRHTPAVPFPFRRVLTGRAGRLSAIIRRVAARYPFARVADLYEEGTLPVEEYAGDGFHPSAAGYRRWAEVMAGSLTRIPRLRPPDDAVRRHRD